MPNVDYKIYLFEKKRKLITEGAEKNSSKLQYSKTSFLRSLLDNARLQRIIQRILPYSSCGNKDCPVAEISTGQ